MVEPGFDWADVARLTQVLVRQATTSALFDQGLAAFNTVGAQAAAIWLYQRASYRLELIAEHGLEAAREEADGRKNWADLFKIPLNAGGALIGVVELYTDADEGFGETQCQAFTVLAAALAAGMQQAHLGEQLRSARAEAAAKGAVEALETIINSLPQGVVLLDPAGRVLLANAPGRTYLGVLTDADDVVSELNGQPLEDLIDRAVAAGDDLCRVETEHRGELGRRHFSVTVVPVRENQVLIGTVLSLDDVSLRRQTEQRMFHDARLASVGEFAAGLAHELNNPMMIILGLAEMLQDNPELPDSAQQRLIEIEHAALRAAAIVNRLTVFSDTQSQGGWGVLELQEVVERAVELVGPRCEAAGIELTLDYAENVPPVNGDVGKLEQLLLDLLYNAQEALIQSGRQGGHVRLKVRPVLDEVWLDVEDDGPGVPPEHRERIFDMFYTTKREHQGQGLGLSIAHRVAVEHNGSLALEAGEAGGTIFRLTLPRHHWVQSDALAC